jgi:hypothetical protein
MQHHECSENTAHCEIVSNALGNSLFYARPSRAWFLEETNMNDVDLVIAVLLFGVPLGVWMLVRFIRLSINVGEIKQILLAAHSVEPYETVATWKDGKQLTEYSKGFRISKPQS